MLNFEDKVYYIAGVANKKSVATHVAKSLEQAGAKLIFSAQNEKNLENIKKLFPNSPAFILDVENEESLEQMSGEIKKHYQQIDGFLHSLAFANFSEGFKPFHQTKRQDFLQATQISSFSLVEMSNQLSPLFSDGASVVTISISSTKATSYGYLGPVKAMLDSTIDFLAKSFSQNKNIRFNAVKAGPIKTSASAGIPDYLENYIYSENLTLRKKALKTSEVSNTVCFLLSDLASGINASTITVDAGMSCNYFDQDIVKAFVKEKF